MITKWDIGPAGCSARPCDRIALNRLIEEQAQIWESHGVSHVESVIRARALMADHFMITLEVVAKECRLCGAPMGRIDPDNPSVDRIVFVTCPDCREG